jgi:hypothetical protein
MRKKDTLHLVKDAPSKPPLPEESITETNLVSYLPMLLLLRSDMQTIVNKIDAYEQLCIRGAWGTEDVSGKQERLVASIQRRLMQAARRVEPKGA